MLPEKRIPEHVLDLKKEAVEERRTSNHHAGDGFRTFPELPRKVKNPEEFLKKIK